MKKCIFAKVLILGIIFLFLGTGVFPIISGSIENKYKTDLSESSLQLPLESNLWVIGLMQIINKTEKYLEVKNIFGLWITKGFIGGFFESDELLIIYGFNGIASRSIVIGMYDNITRP